MMHEPYSDCQKVQATEPEHCGGEHDPPVATETVWLQCRPTWKVRTIFVIDRHSQNIQCFEAPQFQTESLIWWEHVVLTWCVLKGHIKAIWNWFVCLFTKRLGNKLRSRYRMYSASIYIYWGVCMCVCVVLHWSDKPAVDCMAVTKKLFTVGQSHLADARDAK